MSIKISVMAGWSGGCLGLVTKRHAGFCGHVRLVQCVIMNMLHTICGQIFALPNQQIKGNFMGVFITDIFEPSMQPVRHAGLTFTGKIAHGFKIMNRQQPRHNRRFNADFFALIAESVK